MKKILGSSVMIVMVITIIIGGTNAFFSDTQVSQGNVMAAGSIDLKVNHTAQTYNDISCQTCDVTIYSSTDTRVIDSSIGAASENDLPKDAELVTTINPTWLDASTIAPAEWIWVTPIVDIIDTTSNAEYTFEDTFFLQGPIALTGFDLEIASDNGYKIEINGVTIVDRLNDTGTFTGLNPLTTTQETDFQNALIQNGQNSLQITVRNLAGTSDPSQNPAGLIYKIEFTNQDCEAGVADFQTTCELWQSTNLTNERFFNFSDVKPGDYGSNLISLTVTDNEAYMCLAVNNKEDEELGIGGGSLGDHLYVKGYYADGYGNKGDIMFGPTKLNNLNNITYADSTTNPDVPPVTPGDTNYVLLEWCFGEYSNNGFCNGNVSEINDTQLAQYLADLQFYAIQTRSNDEFNCQELEFPVSQNNQ